MENVLGVVAIASLLLAGWAAWYVRRAVAEAGRLAQSALGRAGSDSGGARFRLQHVSRHRYVLRNEGDSTAYGVRLDISDLVLQEGSVVLSSFPPGHGARYMLIQPVQVHVAEISVSWHDRPDCLDAPRSVRLPLQLRLDHPEHHGA